MRPIRLLVVAVVLSLLAPTVAGAQAALPPSLEGERFFALDENGFVEGELEVEGNCTPTAGETFTITYRAEGLAFGPYPGTFTETGTVTVLLTGPRSGVTGTAVGQVTSWRANFTIDSLVGQVSGKKTLSATPLFTSRAVCARSATGFFGYAFLDAEQAVGALDYEATITTATGTFRDQGQAEATIERACGGVSPGTCSVTRSKFFRESFVLSTGVLRLDTTGKATGGGQIGDLTSLLTQVSFGFEVKRTEAPERLQGRCLVNDRAERTQVKCLTVTSYQQVGNTATWEGEADVNGEREEYRITVQDNGEPNQGIDTFSIVTESYEAGGNVTHGNVQLHKQELAP